MTAERFIGHFGAAELLWLQQFFHSLLRSVPSSDYEPYVSGGSFDETECRETLREQVTGHGEAVVRAVLRHGKTGHWPRLSKHVSFELYERLSAAKLLVIRTFQAGKFSAAGVTPQAPQDYNEVLKNLLIHYWDDVASNAWVAENASRTIDRPPDYD